MRPAPLGAVIGACCIWLLSSACSEEPKAVKQASCNAICTRSYTEATCKAAATGAGCEKSSFIPVVEGCTNGCAFEECDQVPSCGSGTALDGGP
jgi:hypothetical protein